MWQAPGSNPGWVSYDLYEIKNIANTIKGPDVVDDVFFSFHISRCVSQFWQFRIREVLNNNKYSLSIGLCGVWRQGSRILSPWIQPDTLRRINDNAQLKRAHSFWCSVWLWHFVALSACLCFLSTASIKALFHEPEIRLLYICRILPGTFQPGLQGSLGFGIHLWKYRWRDMLEYWALWDVIRP